MKPVSCTSTISQHAPPSKPIRGEFLAQRNPSKKRATTKNFLRLLIRASFSLVFAGGLTFWAPNWLCRVESIGLQNSPLKLERFFTSVLPYAKYVSFRKRSQLVDTVVAVGDENALARPVVHALPRAD